jgi:hypothetical protein
MRMEIVELIAEGSKVAARFRWGLEDVQERIRQFGLN